MLQEKTCKNTIKIGLKCPINHAIGGVGSGKTNSLLNLINHQLDIDKIYLYVKDPYEAKYQLLLNKSKKVGLKQCNDRKAFIEYSYNMDNIYESNDFFFYTTDLHNTLK